MSLVGRIPGQHEQVRHLQELTRRDETKLPSSDAVGPWIDATPYLQPGWTGVANYPSYPAPRYYVDRERLYLIGEVIYDSTVTGHDASFPIWLPVTVAHRADVMVWTVPNGGQPTTRDQLHWFGHILSTGKLFLDQNNDPLVPAPDNGYPPHDTWLMFDISFRLT